MLSRAAKFSQPAVAHTIAAVHAPARAQHCPTLSRSFQSRSAVAVSAVAPSLTLNRTSSAAPSLLASPSSQSQSQSNSTDSNAARAALAASAFAIFSYVLSQLEGEQYTELRAGLSTRLAEIRSLTGLEMTTAECAPAAAPAQKLNFAAAKEVIDATPVVGEDRELAPGWKRVIAYIIDNGLMMLVDALMVVLLAAVQRNNVSQSLDEHFQRPPQVLFNVAIQVVWEVVWFTLTNGQTPGKFMLNIRTVKQDDFSRMDPMTSAIHAVSRSILTPFAAADLWLPYVLPKRFTGGKNLLDENQLMHNYFSGTIVVDLAPKPVDSDYE